MASVKSERAEPATALDCTHCGLPVPPGLVQEGAETQFCCSGCETVYGVIHEHGLERYYALREDEDRQVAKTSGRRYDEFDDPAFLELYARTREDGLAEIELLLEGVHCAACVWLVEKVPAVREGVIEVRLDLPRRRARVVWNPEAIALGAIARLLDSLGYPVHPYRRSEAEKIARREDRRLLLRLGVSGAAAGNVMLIAFALYGGMFHGMAAEYETFFRWTSLIIAVPAVLYGGSVFFRGAWAALRTGALHMDLPISIGILAGFGWGAVNTVRGTGEIYFESVTALVFLLLAGRLVQQRRQRAARDAAELLFALAPASARLVEPGAAEGEELVREVPVEVLRPGCLVELRAGDAAPADGVVARGTSRIDLSLLTGESRPVAVEPGAELFAGTVNLGARLVVRVDKTGEETRVGKLMALVEESAGRKAPIVLLANRLAGWFTAAALALAAVTFLVWLALEPGAPDAAIERAVALLIVTCPCALGLATPLAVSAAIGKAARRGILIKGADVLERLARPARLWLDKTGTLTRGETRLVHWSGDARVLPLVAALEQHSAHPLAEAFLAALEEEPFASAVRGGLPEAEHVDESLGGGVRGRVAGVEVVVGSPGYLERMHGALDTVERARVRSITEKGHTPVLVALDGALVAEAAFGDPLREEAPALIAKLRKEGWQAGILSGDHQDVVSAVGGQLGLPEEACRGGVVPEQKLAAVSHEGGDEAPVMVGDGVNDAAALAAAGVGIAVRGGAEAALAAADVYLSEEGLAPLDHLLSGAARTLRVIRRNLIFSLLYNVVGATLAITGVINPLIAAILMPASSLTVLTISFRSKTF